MWKVSSSLVVVAAVVLLGGCGKSPPVNDARPGEGSPAAKAPVAADVPAREPASRAESLPKGPQAPVPKSDAPPTESAPKEAAPQAADPQLRGALVAVAGHESEYASTAESLSHQYGDQAASRVAGFLDDPDAAVRGTAAQLLLRLFHPQDRATVAVFLKALGDRQADVRHVALHAARRMEPSDLAEAVPLLARLLHPDNEGDATYRAVAAQLLGAAPAAQSAALDDLMQALQHDPESRVRLACVVAVERVVGPEKAADILRGIAASDADAAVRRLAVVRLGKLTVFTDQTIADVARALRDRDAAVRQAAMEAMIGFGSPAATALADALSDPDPNTRKLALYALARLGPAAAAAAPAVKRCIEDPDPEVRKSAQTVLKLLGSGG